MLSSMRKVTVVVLVAVLAACGGESDEGEQIALGDDKDVTENVDGETPDDGLVPDVSDPPDEGSDGTDPGDDGSPPGDEGGDASEPECTQDFHCADAFDKVTACEDVSCENELCVKIAKPDCCLADDDCLIGDACTVGACSFPGGTCDYSDVEAECTADDDCLVDNPCVIATCAGVCGTCELQEIQDCCVLDDQCADDDGCTDDLCIDGQCEHSNVCKCQDDVDCDDDDPCSFEFCGEDGVCEYELSEDCCSEDADCDDGNPCTKTGCIVAVGACTAPEPIEGCCVEDEQCEDGDPCTSDACVDGACVSKTSDEPCCEVDGDCDDGNPCTAGKCSDGACTYETAPDCCVEDAECDDGSECTFDLCFANQCLNSEPAGGCCETVADCGDGNPCLIWSCTGSKCLSEEVGESCCTADDECDDKNVCTIESCTDGGDCAYETVADCCNEDAQCDDGDKCTGDTCDPTGKCVQAPIAGCCNDASDCDDGDGCTADSCSGAGKCAHEPVEDCCDPSSGTEILNIGFTPNVVDGVTFNPSFGFYRWRESTSVAFAGPAAMYFGSGGGDSYCTSSPFGGAPDGTATLPIESAPYPTGVIDLPKGTTATLTFQARLDMRAGANVDKLWLVVLEEGAAALEIWNKGSIPADKYTEWVPVSVDLSDFAGKKIQLRFHFDVVDKSGGGGCASGGSGPRIDEVKVLVSDCAIACNGDLDCITPPNECFASTGICTAGECVYAPSGLCCETDTDCDDKNACSEDACILGTCQHQNLLNCCNGDDDCAPDNPCVAGLCDAATKKCAFEKLDGPGCCDTVSDCEGGTGFCAGALACEAGQCVDNSGGKTEEHMTFVFTDGVDGWSTSQSGGFYWRESSAQVVSPALSMYFGNNSSNHYCSSGGGGGAPDGVANLPGSPSDKFPGGTIEVEAGGKTSLSFQIFADIRSTLNRDQITVRLDTTAGDEIVLWTKEDLGGGNYEKWVPVTIDLTPHAPFTGKVRFFFDVVAKSGQGGCFNGGAGLFIDDVKVEQTCSP